VTVPGEMQGRLAERVKRAVGARWPHVVVAGVSNDYLGYFVTAADYGRPAYVTCAALYGREGGEAIATGAVDVLLELAGSPGRLRALGQRAIASAAGGETAGERGLLAGGGVAVNHALRHGLVERADGVAHRLRGVAARGVVTGTRRLARGLDGGADAGADGPVAQAPALALPHLLHRRLRVRQGMLPPSLEMEDRRASCPNVRAIAT
jgi:hypothetical protein